MKKVAVVTGTRADYGLLFPLMKALMEEAEIRLQIIVTGMHLSPEFGLTYREIEQDGFVIDEKVELVMSSDSRSGVTKSMGIGLIGMAGSLERLDPDLMVLLGDRYEALCAATAAALANVPIAHIHGGERTEGTMDEMFRHAITKLSHLHFTATEEYRRRVVQLGESPDRVFCFGAMAGDQIALTPLMERAELEESLSFSLGSPFFLITFHPVTWTEQSAEEQCGALMSALERFPGAGILFTKPNSDPGGRALAALIDRFVDRHPERAKSFISLGRQRYLSALRYADVVIGNSSSGIIEAPIFKKATVNIGDRQKGRVRGGSVIDCDNREDAIVRGIELALSEPFRRSLESVVSLYGDGGASQQIVERIKRTDLSSLVVKPFYDLDNG